MACTQPNLPIEIIPNVSPVNISGATIAETTRRFLFSDNPESIFSADFGSNKIITLWHDTVTGRNTVSYRAYLWHLNKTANSIKVGMTIGNGSAADTYRVENLRMQADITTNFAAQGICCAKALIGNTMDIVTPVDASILPGRVALVREWTLSPDRLIGAVMEFDLVNTTSSTNALIYRVRTVASSNTTENLRLHQGAPVSPNHPSHPRGSWSFAGIQGNTVTYNLGSGDLNTSISNSSTDNVFTAANSFDSANAISLTGQWGARYYVTVNLRNTSSTTRRNSIYLNGRGGIYGGAVRVDSGATNGVPILQPFTQGVLIATRDVPVNGNINVNLIISNAGSTNTPVAILCRTQ
ncbi:MAG: hypothetical protein DDT21_02695 [Syntrophomonadaceae bacterium]|nr:hypothetical protein [Bacillota bacterium]